VVNRALLRWIAAVYWLLAVGAASAADPAFKLTLRDHRFEPAELVVPAGQKIKLEVENQDATPEEFESYELNREKVVPAKATIVISCGAIEARPLSLFRRLQQG